MRLWHLLFGVMMASVLITIGREAYGRVAIVVFAGGLGEFVVGTTAIMMLFQTIGAIGQARTPFRYAEAIIATLFVLVVASGFMVAILWVGIDLVQRVVP